MAKPRIVVLALGGTIATVPGARGAVTGLNAEDLIAAVPGIEGLATISARTVQKIGSSDLTIEILLKLAEEISELASNGEIDGAIITQGTDSLEETCFFLDCVLELDIPVIVIGAMRNNLMLSPDGPGNLLAAVRVATDPAVRAQAHDLGVIVAMLDNVHAAIELTKADSNRIDAFASRQGGPIGYLVEDRVRIDLLPRRDWKSTLAPIFRKTSIPALLDNPKNVAFYTTTLDDQGALLKAIVDAPNSLGYSGIVLATMGGGHVPSTLLDSISALSKRMPVVQSSRAGPGYLLHKTYENTGSEFDLLDRGIIPAGRLHPLKARMLLTILLMAKASSDEMAKIWDALN